MALCLCETRDGLRFSFDEAAVLMLEKLANEARARDESIAMFSHLSENQELLLSFGFYDDLTFSDFDRIKIRESVLFLMLSEKARLALQDRNLRLIGSQVVIS